MKKFLLILISSIALIAIAAPEQEAEAQTVYSRQCCDANGVIRCTLVNWTPVGNACFCYGQGWGLTC